MLLHVRRASRVVTQVYETALADSNLHPMQFLLLVAITRAGPTPVSTLADRLQLDRTTLTRNLTALVDSELVTVSVDSDDRRSRIVTIAPRGRSAIEKSYESWEGAQRKVTKHLGADIQPLIAALNQLSALK